MTDTILRFDGPDVQPDLYAADIPFSATGLSRATVVDVADAETYRAMTREALALAARLTVQLRRAEAVIVALRTELRARRAA